MKTAELFALWSQFLGSNADYCFFYLSAAVFSHIEQSSPYIIIVKRSKMFHVKHFDSAISRCRPQRHGFAKMPFRRAKKRKSKRKSPLTRAFSLSERIFAGIFRGLDRFFGISKPFGCRYPICRAIFFAARRGIRAFLSLFRPP